VKDKGNRNAFYPITYQTEQGCGNGQSGIIDWIGDNNWFQGTNVPGYSAAINCFGFKPAEDVWNKLSPSISIGDKGRALNGPVPGGSVLPFNRDKWSRYTTSSAAPPVPPPVPAPAANSCSPLMPSCVPLERLQWMFNNAGCTRILKESDVPWWRQRATIDVIQTDMNLYGSLTASGKADARQKNFCKP